LSEIGFSISFWLLGASRASHSRPTSSVPTLKEKTTKRAERSHPKLDSSVFRALLVHPLLHLLKKRWLVKRYRLHRHVSAGD
jgi:hypothetical protein